MGEQINIYCVFKKKQNKIHASLFVDMTGIIPEDEDEQDMYDDVGAIADTPAPEPIDEDLYEELPGLIPYFITAAISTWISVFSCFVLFFFSSHGLFSCYCILL